MRNAICAQCEDLGRETLTGFNLDCAALEKKCPGFLRRQQAETLAQTVSRIAALRTQRRQRLMQA